jgi:hypothetical protein
MVNDVIVIENAKLIFRNFAGKESKFNAAGNRNFCVVLDPELADKLKADGWNIRELQPREEGEAPQPYMQVSVKFGNIPPKITTVANGIMTELTEATVGGLDFADIISCDLVIRPYNWEVNGNTGVKAYVKSLYVNLEVDPFEAKYMAGPNEVPFK